MSECVREAINKQGRRQTWLAEQMGITPVRLSKLLSGELRWRVEEALKVAELLGLPPEALFLPECGKVGIHDGK